MIICCYIPVYALTLSIIYKKKTMKNNYFREICLYIDLKTKPQLHLMAYYLTLNTHIKLINKTIIYHYYLLFVQPMKLI